MSARRLEAKIAASARLFAALGDQTRLRILIRLANGQPLSITALSEGAALTRQAVTKHLHVLAKTGVVSGVRQGREQIWELQSQSIAQAQELLDAIGTKWENALNRLKIRAEEP